MNTADNESMDHPCPYEMQLISEAAAIKKHNLRVMIEPTLLAIIIVIGYFTIVSHMQQRDEKARQEEQAKARQAICQSNNYKYAADICQRKEEELHV